MLKQTSRIPVYGTGDAIDYIIHDSMIYKFITDRTLDAPAGTPPLNPANVMLAEFLAHPADGGTMANIVQNIAFVAIESTLADAQAQMVAKKGAKDVIVTKTGSPKEPVEGWITDVDIARFAQVQ